jgi:hypothetical protein
MALPTSPTNQSTNGGSTYGLPEIVSARASAVVGKTNFVAQNTTGGAVTCNLATDTLIYSPEGTVWDDTQSCWVPSYMLNLGPTPRK